MNPTAIHTVIFMEVSYQYRELLFPDGGNEFYDWSECDVLNSIVFEC